MLIMNVLAFSFGGSVQQWDPKCRRDSLISTLILDYLINALSQENQDKIWLANFPSKFTLLLVKCRQWVVWGAQWYFADIRSVLKFNFLIKIGILDMAGKSSVCCPSLTENVLVRHFLQLLESSNSLINSNVVSWCIEVTMSRWWSESLWWLISQQSGEYSIIFLAYISEWFDLHALRPFSN